MTTPNSILIGADHLQELAFRNPGAIIELGDGYAFLTVGHIAYCAVLPSEQTA